MKTEFEDAGHTYHFVKWLVHENEKLLPAKVGNRNVYEPPTVVFASDQGEVQMSPHAPWLLDENDFISVRRTEPDDYRRVKHSQRRERRLNHKRKR